MKLKIFLLLLAATLVGTGVWLKLEERKEILAEVESIKRRWMPDFDLNSVSEVIIKTNRESLLIKKNADTWSIQGETPQRADLARIGQLVQRMKNIKPTEEVTAGPAQFAGFELLEPDGVAQGAGTLVELRDKDSRRIGAIIVGKQAFARPDPQSPFPPSPNGRFIVPAGSSGPVGVVTEGFDSISSKIEAWVERSETP
ncbi:MAG: hypothetical protein EBY32_04650 [Proteobacteria bacterium]|jgi:hypothetical protein|nr:hypothetical protein [Pseudomonadota bacterium]